MLSCKKIYFPGTVYKKTEIERELHGATDHHITKHVNNMYK